MVNSLGHLQKNRHVLPGYKRSSKKLLELDSNPSLLAITKAWTIFLRHMKNCSLVSSLK